MTHMTNGYCFAGITREGKWVRPILPKKEQWHNLNYNSGEKIRIGDILDVEGRPYPIEPPHTEDIIVNDLSKIGHLSHTDLMSLLALNVEQETALRETLRGKTRSLCLIDVDEFNIVYRYENDNKRSRLNFRIHNGPLFLNNTFTPGYPCVSLHWRNIISQDIALPENFNQIYLGIGLSRAFLSNDRLIPPSPMIITILTDPPLPGDINYSDP